MRKTLVLAVTALVLAACKLPASAPPADFNVGDLSRPVSFSVLYDSYFMSCATCHSPSALSMNAGIEQTLDFSTRATAYTSMTTGLASGLTGGLEACNGAAFVAATAPTASLSLAALGPPFAQNFSGPSGCDSTVITDESKKTTTAMPAAFATDFSAWIGQGALNN